MCGNSPSTARGANRFHVSGSSASIRSERETSPSLCTQRGVRNTLSKVPSIVTLHNKFTRTLTFENSWLESKLAGADREVQELGQLLEKAGKKLAVLVAGARSV